MTMISADGSESVVARVSKYLEEYAGLKEDAPLWTNYLSASQFEYSITPLPSSKTVSTTITGVDTNEFHFAFQSNESTAEELERIQAFAFYEAFMIWMKKQTAEGILPQLGKGRTAKSIAATTWGFLYSQGESQTGIYQIQCVLTYEDNNSQ